MSSLAPLEVSTTIRTQNVPALCTPCALTRQTGNRARIHADADSVSQSAQQSHHLEEGCFPHP